MTKGHGPVHVENSYLDRFYAWINETFPHPDHQLINQAIPAVRPTSAPVHSQKWQWHDLDSEQIMQQFQIRLPHPHSRMGCLLR